MCACAICISSHSPPLVAAAGAMCMPHTLHTRRFCPSFVRKLAHRHRRAGYWHAVPGLLPVLK